MTRRLHALRVGNFKAFADTQRIPLKPITLIFGPNSAGKSSLIQSLALAHEAQFGREKQGRARLDVHHTEVGGSAIDLGGYRQFVHRGQLRNGVEWGAELKAATLKADPKFQQISGLLATVDILSLIVRLGIELDKYDRPVPKAEPRLDTVEILADDEVLLRMSRRDKTGTTLRLDRLASDHAVFRGLLQAIVEGWTTSPEMREDDFKAADATIADLLPELVVHADAFLPSGVELARSDSGETSKASMLFPVSKGNRGEDIAQAIRFQLPRSLNDLVKGMTDALAGELAGLKYLGPLREVPPRHVAFQQHQDENWVSGGNFAWELLLRDEALRETVNQWLGGHPGVSGMDVAMDMVRDKPRHPTWMKTPYRLEVARFYSGNDLLNPLVSTFLDRPLTLIERREMLTKELAEVERELREQYELKPERIEDEVALLGPWIEQIQTAKSGAEREHLLEQAMKELSGSMSDEDWEEIRVQQQIDQIPHDEALGKAEEFIKSLDIEGVHDISELRLFDVRKSTAVSLRDVGIGISQVLPVLALAYGSREQLIAIEQPEIHLHPALQAELADVFIESAVGERKNVFILETHSEHLILRLLRRIRETSESRQVGAHALRPEDVQVLYLQPLSLGARVVCLEIRSDGEFVAPWPDGFFPERAEELF